MLTVSTTNQNMKYYRQCKYNPSIEVCSRNNFCRGKAVTITYSEYVCSLTYLT